MLRKKGLTLCDVFARYKYWVYDKENKDLNKYRLRIRFNMFPFHYVNTEFGFGFDLHAHSQVVVLPPFQRQGYGSKLLNALFTFARQDRSILDVSVEDPSEDFQALRDVTDAKTLNDADCLHKLALPNPPISEMVHRFKICKQQMKRLATIAKFIAIKECDPLTDPEKKVRETHHSCAIEWRCSQRKRGRKSEGRGERGGKGEGSRRGGREKERRGCMLMGSAGLCNSGAQALGQVNSLQAVQMSGQRQNLYPDGWRREGCEFSNDVEEAASDCKENDPSQLKKRKLQEEIPDTSFVDPVSCLFLHSCFRRNLGSFLSLSHQQVENISKSDVQEALEMSAHKIWSNGGRYPPLFRPPAFPAVFSISVNYFVPDPWCPGLVGGRPLSEEEAAEANVCILVQTARYCSQEDLN
eukprot:768710-Hanusia_phi.AAC.3